MTVIDLFAGAGGFSTGFEDAGFTVSWAVDNNEKVEETFNENHHTDITIADIRAVDPSEVSVEKSAVDVVIGGPPCPTFSTVGRTVINSLDGQSTTEDERHHLYQEFLRFVDYFEPEVFVMENVKGMLSAENKHGEDIIEVITSEMESLGYEITVQVLNAANFGVPQTRERVFFVGSANQSVSDFDLSEWASHRPPETNEEQKLTIKQSESAFPKYEKNLEEKQPWNTVADAILDLPPVTPDGETPPKKMTEYTMNPVSEYQHWVRDDSSELLNHTCRGHNMRDLTLYKLLSSSAGYTIGELPEEHQIYRSDIFNDKIRKQDPMEPASTVVAHLSKDGHRFVHPTEARSITVREAARLQSFKDSFDFPTPRTYAFRQVGNAVPPLLAQAIATAIKTELL